MYLLSFLRATPATEFSEVRVARAESVCVASVVELLLLGNSQVVSELSDAVRVLRHGHRVRDDTADTTRVVLMVNNLCLVSRLDAGHGILVERLLGLFQLNIASDIVGLTTEELLLEIVSSVFMREHSLHFLLAQDHFGQVVIDNSSLNVQLLVVRGAGAWDLCCVQDHLVPARHTLPSLLSAEYITLGRHSGRLVADHRVELASRVE